MVDLKTYRASSIAEALGQIKKDLGPDAVVLHTRTFKRGGVLGVGARQIVEITASSGDVVADSLKKRAGRQAPPAGTTANGGRRELLRSAYARAQGSGRSERPTQRSIAKVPVEAAAPAEHAVRSAPAPAPRQMGVRPSRIVTGPALERAGGGDGGDAPGTLIARSADVGHVAPQRGSQAGLWDEIATIKRLVGQVLQVSRPSSVQPAMPDSLFKKYLALLESEVAAEIADEIIGAVRDELNERELADEEIVHRAVLRRLALLIPTGGQAPMPSDKPDDGRPLTVALVGPTGVGKTTTVAKLAATYKLRQGRKVGLVTCDTYRIAAVDQLRTYANIINVPLKVALTPKEMTAACEGFAECDVVLIDTAGRSQHDADRLDELSRFVVAANPHETHLVLSGAASESTLTRSAQRFRVVGPNRVIFTKLDEVVNFGVILNTAKTVGAKLSYVTTGQEVPDHIEPGRSDRLARLVLEGGSLE